MKKIILILCVMMFLQPVKAQSSLLDFAKSELYKINQVFDSSQYLGFNLDIFYKSDSAAVTKETDAMSGNYVLNKKNLFYTMGNTTYVQTDSFAYTMYTDEKMMIMNKSFVMENSDAFPLKTFIDSAMRYYSNAFSVSIDSTMSDSAVETRRITFTANNSLDFTNNVQRPPYGSFFIEYASDSYYPLKFQFSYQDMATVEIDDSTTSNNITAISPYPVLKTVTMTFSQYKAFVNTSIFDDAQYVRYNRQRKVYEPAAPYKNYRFITSGFENEDEDAKNYREVPFNGN